MAHNHEAGGSNPPPATKLQAAMPYTRPTDEGDVVMVEIRPHIFVREDFARENGMSTLAPKREPKVKAKVEKAK